MSGTEETEMLYQIVTHGEAFCPSTMTKETPFANRKLLLEETTNNEKKNEIKEGHYYVVAKLYFKGMMEIINILVFAALLLNDTIKSLLHVDLFYWKIQLESWPLVWFVWMLCNLVFGRQTEKYKKKERQRVTHGEAFCPSTMTKETPFANRKLLLDEITNNEKKNEIKEGHYYVVAWLFFQGMMDFINILVFADLYLKVTLERWVHVELLLPYKMHSCPWVWWGLALCNIVFGRQRVYCPRCNSWFFGTEEGQIEKYKNKKEWQKKKRCLLLVKITNNERKAMEAGQIEENEIKEGHDDVEEKQNNKLKIEPFYQSMYLPRYTCDFLMKEGQMEEYNKKESQKKREVRIDQYEADWSLLYSQSAVFSPSCRVSSEHMGTRYDNSSSWCVNYVPEEESSERRTNTKLDEILENWLKTEGKSTDAVDFLKNYQPLPPKEAIPKKKRNMKHHGMLPMSGQTGRYVVQGGAQKEKGKLIENPELSGKIDDAEKDIQELEQLLRCKVCLDSDACIVFLPCRHMATCEYCEGFLHHCPVCRSFIEEAVKINEE